MGFSIASISIEPFENITKGDQERTALRNVHLPLNSLACFEVRTAGLYVMSALGDFWVVVIITTRFVVVDWLHFCARRQSWRPSELELEVKVEAEAAAKELPNRSNSLTYNNNLQATASKAPLFFFPLLCPTSTSWLLSGAFGSAFTLSHLLYTPGET